MTGREANQLIKHIEELFQCCRDGYCGADHQAQSRQALDLMVAAPPAVRQDYAYQSCCEGRWVYHTPSSLLAIWPELSDFLIDKLGEFTGDVDPGFLDLSPRFNLPLLLAAAKHDNLIFFKAMWMYIRPGYSNPTHIIKSVRELEVKGEVVAWLSG